MRRVLVTGGRNYSDRASVFSALDAIAALNDRLTVIEGGASGADALARAWCGLHPEHEHITEPANWTDLESPPVVKRRRRDGSYYNAAAGGIRNQKMIDAHRPEVVLAFEGGSGTADMIKRARLAQIPVIEVPRIE